MPQDVCDACDERALRPDDDQIDAEGMRKCEDTFRVFCPNRVAVAETRDSGIPGGGVEIGDGGRLGELPGQRVLPPPGADEENPHDSSLCGS